MTSKPAPPQAARRDAAGFTLIEACLAFTALAVGLLALAHLQAALQSSVEAARENGLAVRLAQAALERQRQPTVPSPSAAAGAPGPVRSVTDLPAAADGLLRGGRLVLELTDHPALPLGMAHVTVSWQDRLGRPQSVRLDTLISAAP